MSQNSSDPFSHASHNYDVCYKLKKLGGCDDWVITTAFYAGMKFLQDKLFPGDYPHPRKIGEVSTFKSFSHYISSFGRLDPGSNKHQEMSKFVASNINNEDVVNSYEDLKQSCHTARYINYQVGEDRLKMALEALEIIKNFCVS